MRTDIEDKFDRVNNVEDEIDVNLNVHVVLRSAFANVEVIRNGLCGYQVRNRPPCC